MKCCASANTATFRYRSLDPPLQLPQKPQLPDLLPSPCLSAPSSIDDGGFHLTIQTEHDDDLVVRTPASALQIQRWAPDLFGLLFPFFRAQ